MRYLRAVSAAAPRPALFTAAYARVLALHTCYGISLATFLLFPKYVVTQLGASPTEVGNAMAIFGVANVLTVPLVGIGVDRFGRRTFILMGLFAMGVSALGFVFIDEMGPTLYLLRALQGSSFAFVWLSSATLVTDSAPPERLGQGLALLGATMHGTNAVVPMLVELASEKVGWNPVFITSAVAAAVAAAIALGVRSSPRDDPASPPSRLLSMLRRGPVQRIVLVSLCAGTVLATLTTFIQPYALERGSVRVGGFFLAFSITVMIVRVVLGAWMDRGNRWVVCTSAMAIYAALLLLAPRISVSTLPLLGCLFGLVHGFFIPTFNAMSLVGAPALERGRILALLSGGFNIGHAFSSFAFGALAATAGYGSTFTAAAWFAIMGTVLLLAFRGAARWSSASGADD